MMNKDLLSSMIEETRLHLQIETKKTTDCPIAIILGGQPGSGKSSCIEHLESTLHRNVVTLNGDDFRKLHPSYEEKMRSNPAEAIKETQQYTNAIVTHFIEELSEKKYNLIVEGTMRDASVSTKTIEQLHKKGYSCQIALVAAYTLESQTFCIVRRENEILTKGYGRPVPVEKHDEAYQNIPTTLHNIEKMGKVSQFTIFNSELEAVFCITQNPECDVHKKYIKIRSDFCPKRLKSCLDAIAPFEEIIKGRGLKEEIHQLEQIKEQLLKEKI